MKCLLDACKRGFYRAADSIFGQIGRTLCFGRSCFAADLYQMHANTAVWSRGLLIVQLSVKIIGLCH